MSGEPHIRKVRPDDLEALVGCGFRIGELAVFLASRPFGRPELYLSSGPILY